MILILNGRNSGEIETGSELRFIDAIGQSWTESVTLIRRKLEHCIQSLNDLGRAPLDSGIGLVLKNYRNLANTIMQELECCAAVERLVLELEQEWINSSIEQVLHDTEPASIQPVSARKGIWYGF
jgi:hypothetical protein